MTNHALNEYFFPPSFRISLPLFAGRPLLDVPFIRGIQSTLHPAPTEIKQNSINSHAQDKTALHLQGLLVINERQTPPPPFRHLKNKCCGESQSPKYTTIHYVDKRRGDALERFSLRRTSLNSKFRKDWFLKTHYYPTDAQIYIS